MNPPSCALILTAAGASVRMGDGPKKEYRDIEGVPVLARALLPFLAVRGISRVVVTVPAGDIARASALLAPHVSLAGVSFVEGGASRQESVRRGLAALRAAPPDIVLIHDGARPWVSAELIERVRAAAERCGACVPVLEAREAVKRVTEDGVILQHLPRQSLRFAQTPQGFSFARILEAHEKARANGVQCADDGEIFGLYAGPVEWVPGDPRNRKITWPGDVEAPRGGAAQ